MGLDMFAYATDERPATEVDFPEPEKSDELYYWRKHDDLHEWMTDLYLEKGGRDPEFNLAPVKLSADDLDALEALLQGTTPMDSSGGYLWLLHGSRDGDDLEFVTKAKEAIGQGRVVFYVAWW